MQAIDEVERIRRTGTLTYFHAAGGEGHPDPEVIEYVAVTLTTPDDPPDRCVGNVVVEWASHFANGALAPRIKAEGGNAKMLHLFPQILAPFAHMEHGALTPGRYMELLEARGIRRHTGNRLLDSPTMSCARCQGLFPVADYSARHAKAQAPLCQWCASWLAMEGHPDAASGTTSSPDNSP